MRIGAPLSLPGIGPRGGFRRRVKYYDTSKTRCSVTQAETRSCYPERYEPGRTLLCFFA